MKVAILLLVVLGFVAFSQGAPAPADELMESEDNNDQSVIDPNCDKAKNGGDAAAASSDSADPEAQASKEGKKQKKDKKDKKKGGKKEKKQD